MLHSGDRAPLWNGNDQNGVLRSSEAYRGTWLLLYFYPQDDTPGCTTEACSFRDNFPSLKSRIAIVGVSGDSEESHKAFETKYRLPFTLIADTDRTIINAYGADGAVFPKRTTFLINPSGSIENIYHGFRIEEHAATVESDLQRLGAHERSPISPSQ